MNCETPPVIMCDGLQVARAIRAFIDAYHDLLAIAPRVAEATAERIWSNALAGQEPEFPSVFAEAMRGYRRPVLTPTEQRQANAITFDESPEDRIAAAWWDMSPTSQAKFRRSIGGGK